MATEIIVLSQTGDNLEIAFYYLVPAQFRSVAARDNTRVVKGEATGILAPQEVQAIKTGIAIEHIVTVNINSLTLEQARAKVDGLYQSEQNKALRSYTDQFSFTKFYRDSDLGWQTA